MATTTSGVSLTLNGHYAQCPKTIPSSEGLSLRTELVLERSEKRTVKVHWWHNPDPISSKPHNHPWNFKSKILHGGYTEQVWWIKNGVVRTETRTYKAGDTNVNTIDKFHKVISVQPGTVSIMTTGQASKNNAWGWLDIETGKYTLATFDPKSPFMKDLKRLNPWMT